MTRVSTKSQYPLLDVLCARMHMDLENKVSNFEMFAMTDPNDENASLSLSQARQIIRSNDIYGYTYPKSDVKTLLKSAQSPKCIFLPDKDLLRRMIKAVVTKDPKESSWHFLVRFSFLDNPHKYI